MSVKDRDILAALEILRYETLHSHDLGDRLSLSASRTVELCEELELCGFTYKEASSEPWRLTLKGRIVRWLYR